MIAIPEFHFNFHEFRKRREVPISKRIETYEFEQIGSNLSIVSIDKVHLFPVVIYFLWTAKIFSLASIVYFYIATLAILFVVELFVFPIDTINT